MKKLICLISVLALLLSMGMSVLAAEFVPSITYKDGPGLSNATLDGEDVTKCLVITSINQAKNKTTDITQDERDLLLQVYDELKNSDFIKDHVIRDLVDVNFKFNDCRQKHDVSEGMAQGGSQSADATETTEGTEEFENKLEVLNNTDAVLTVKFNLGVSAGTDVIVKSYIDGQWTDIKSVVNNGDGTVTCAFEHLCPVLFAVKQTQGGGTTPPKTGEGFNSMPLWIGTMALSGVALVTLVIVAVKKKEH